MAQNSRNAGRTGHGMILLQEAQASTSAMMGKRMDGLDERIQRLVAELDGVRPAHLNWMEQF